MNGHRAWDRSDHGARAQSFLRTKHQSVAWPIPIAQNVLRGLDKGSRRGSHGCAPREVDEEAGLFPCGFWQDLNQVPRHYGGAHERLEEIGEPDARERQCAGASQRSRVPSIRRFGSALRAIGRSFEELGAVAQALNRSRAPVALNWIAGRPGGALAIIGATSDHILENIEALSFDIPADFWGRLERISAPERTFPYMSLDGDIRILVHGGAAVREKRRGYERKGLRE